MAVCRGESCDVLGRLLSLLLVYCCCISFVSSQDYCDRLPSNEELEVLIASTFRVADASATPNITVLEVNYVCLASGVFRDTFRTFSTVVRYECIGSRCPQSDVSQFEFGCLDGAWSNRVVGTTENLRTDVADAFLNSPNRTDCSFCFGPAHSALRTNPQLLPMYDNFNHCLVCDEACSEGDMRCFGFDENSCCNFYDPRDDFRCLNECPAGFDFNDEFECIKIVGFSAPQYTFSESDGVGIVTVDGTSGVEVRVMGGPDNIAGVRASGTLVDQRVITPADIIFNITDDSVAFENDEVFSLNLIVDDPIVTVGVSSTLITIEDDDDSIQVGFDSESYLLEEGETSGVGVRASGETATDVSVILMQEGVAQRELTIVAGDYTADNVIPVEVTNPDNQIALEKDSLLQLALLVPSQFVGGIDIGGQIGSFPSFSNSNLIILDNDVVTISFDPSLYTTLESESERITLSLDTGIARPFSAGVRAEGTGAPTPRLVPSLPNDTYLLNFPSSLSPQTVSFVLVPDDDDVPSEPNEEARLVVFFVSDLAVEVGPLATLVIIDNDILEGGVGFTAASYTYLEDEGEGRVVVEGPGNFPGSLSITISGGPGRQPAAVVTSGSDVNQELTSFPAVVTFPITDDEAALEPVESYRLSLTPSDPSITISQPETEIVILDDGDTITVGFPYDKKTFPASAVGNATLKAFGQAQQPFFVNFIQELGGTIQVEFEPGFYDNDFELQLPLTVPDVITEDISFELVLMAVTEGVEAGGPVDNFGTDSPEQLFASANITIIDDSITVGFLASEYTFPESSTSVPFVLVGKSSDSNLPISVAITAVPDSATTGLIEPSAVPIELSGIVTIPAGTAGSVQYFLDLRNDDVGLEDDEIVTLVLSAPSGSQLRVGGTVDGVEYFPTASVTVFDEDIVTLGIDGATDRTVSEGDSIELCVSKDLASVRAVNFLLTPVPGSAGVEDYSPTVSQSGVLSGSSSSVNPICFSFEAVDDNLPDDGENFSVELRATDGFTSGFQTENDEVDIIIFEPATPPPPTVDLEDTVIGDPLFTVPLPGIGGHLCYEIRGTANKYFNFISDECVSINAHYTEHGALPGQTRSLHVVDQIAILAIDNRGECVRILVDRNGCSTTINDQPLVGIYNSGGMVVSSDGTTVTIVVPNCHILTLELEIVCENTNGVEMIRFDVLRGLNLRETSHGLLGQFWNVSISTEEFKGDFRSGSELTANLVLVTLTSPGSVRRFPAWQDTKTWDNRKECLFAGNQNGGTVYEVSSNQDSLIEGLYTDYVTDSAFSPEFKFSQFNSERC